MPATVGEMAKILLAARGSTPLPTPPPIVGRKWPSNFFNRRPELCTGGLADDRASYTGWRARSITYVFGGSFDCLCQPNAPIQDVVGVEI